MCVIIHLPPTATMLKEHLVNAVHNNHHSWGLVLVDGNGKTQLIRKCPEEGKYDPEEIWSMLEDNKDIHRYLHLRNTTKGATNQENTQPFQVYSSDARQVYFFHNGTLTGFGATNIYNQTVDKNAISDTRDFCEKVLQPALVRWHGSNGPADYLDPYFNSIIMDKQWTATSKGMFVSNDLEPKFYGNGWSNYNKDNPELPIIMVSNTDYFKTVTRGPAKAASGVAANNFFQRDQARQANTKENGAGGKTTGKEHTVNLTHPEITPLTESTLTVSRVVLNKLFRFFDGMENETPEGVNLSGLSNIAIEEWASFCLAEDNPWTIAAMLDFMAQNTAKQYQRAEELEKKLNKAQQHIERIVKEAKHDKKAA